MPGGIFSAWMEANASEPRLSRAWPHRRHLGDGILPGGQVMPQTASARADPSIMNFNDQNRPCRRRCIYARIADVSANGPSMPSRGRSIGGAPINCAPTGYYQSWLLNLIIGDLLRWTEPQCSVSRRSRSPIYRGTRACLCQVPA